MKTPLTVISSYAGFTIRQLRKNAVDGQTEENLVRVQQEAVRLGALLRRAADYCQPLCQGHRNQITVECHPDHPPLTG